MQNFILSLKALITYKDKVIIMGKFKNDKLYIDFPGGRVNQGETLETALERELLEEIPNLEIKYLSKDIKDLLVWEMPSYLINSDHRIIVVFRHISYSKEFPIFNTSNEHNFVKALSTRDIDAHRGMEILEGYQKALDLIQFSP